MTQTGHENKPILEHFKKLFGMGGVTQDGANHFAFCIQGISNMPRIYPYFEEFPPIGIKVRALALFKELVALAANKAHLDPKQVPDLIARAKAINNVYRLLKASKTLPAAAFFQES
jgi:hypothetical protein